MTGKHKMVDREKMKLQRNVFKVVPMISPGAEDDFVDLSPAECLSLVWASPNLYRDHNDFFVGCVHK